MADSKKKKTQSAAESAYGHDAKVLSTPLLLTQKEATYLVKGIKQRGRAIHSFLKDHYFGGKKYLHYQLMRDLDLENILSRHGELNPDQPFNAENLQFWYAPDLIRDSSGQFRVIEDNTGFIGGFGDLRAIEKASKTLTFGLLKNRRAEDFYAQLAKNYIAQARQYGGGKVILLSYPHSMRGTREDKRLAKALLEYGIETSTSTKHFKTKKGKLFYGRGLISFVIINCDPADIDPFDSATYRKYLGLGISEVEIQEQSALRKLLAGGNLSQLHKILGGHEQSNVQPPHLSRGIAGFWNLVRNQQVGTSYIPGIEFVNDKTFYPCIEQLIQIYLKEKPLLRNIPTISLKARQSISKVFDNLPKWVIKKAESQSGDHVWLGKNMKAKEIRNLRKLVTKDPSSYIAQKYIELSRINNHSIDIRPLSVVTCDEIIVSPFPWGRAIDSSGHGKVNLCQGGSFLVTGVV